MIKYILCDIEGTTTSVSFVYDVLFPYFQEKVKSFIKDNIDKTFVKENLDLVKKTVLEEEGIEINDEEASNKLLYWTKTDRKHTALKSLQGYVWKEGYEKGEIKGHLYSDVKPCFEKWKNKNLQIGIYSSGSVQAQKLLFGTSVYGNLLDFFSHHFDTNIGHKKEVNSYKNIKNKITVNAENILFLSDVEAELDAAQEVGYQTIQLVREDTEASKKHKTASNFWKVNDLLENI